MPSASPMPDDFRNAVPCGFFAFFAPARDVEFEETPDFAACLKKMRGTPEARGLLIYLPPEFTVASGLAAGVALEATLHEWCENADRHLKDFRQHRRRVQLVQWPQSDDEIAQLAEIAPGAVQALEMLSPLSDMAAPPFYQTLAALECVRSSSVRTHLDELHARSIGAFGTLPTEDESRDALRAVWQAKEAEIERQAEQIKSLEEQVGTLEVSRNRMPDGRDWRDVLKKAEESLFAEQGRVAALTEESDRRKADFEALQKNFELLQQTHDESTEAEIRLAARIEEAKTAQIAAEQRAQALAPFKARVPELEKRSAELAAQLDAAKAEHASSKEKIRTLTPLKAQVAELERRSAELEKCNASLESTLADLQSENAENHALRDLFKTQVGELEDVLMETDKTGHRRHALLKHQVEQLEFALRVSEMEREKAQSMVERLHGSTSWRFTAPFRGVVGTFKR